MIVASIQARDLKIELFEGDTLEDLVERRSTLGAIDPDACRARVERHFTHHVNAEGFLRMFRHYLADGVLPEGRLLGPL